jgi:ribosome-binding ATPase YchF (GTP1/OBG family)
MLQSTMFNALCENAKAQAANFPFCTIEPNVGIVAVPDPRLEILSNISGVQWRVPLVCPIACISPLYARNCLHSRLYSQYAFRL